jgi:hypothetical protein
MCPVPLQVANPSGGRPSVIGGGGTATMQEWELYELFVGVGGTVAIMKWGTLLDAAQMTTSIGLGPNGTLYRLVVYLLVQLTLCIDYTGIRIGSMGSGASTLLVGEVIIWNRVLTSEERTTAEGYLAMQYFMQDRLSEDHPYRYNLRPSPPLPLPPPLSLPTDISNLLLPDLTVWYKPDNLVSETNLHVSAGRAVFCTFNSVLRSLQLCRVS